ncbi:hypothetical protein JCM6882_004949 [Rhodosporidiobolus microsporus]
MSDKAINPQGKTLVFAYVKAKEGKADELQALLSAAIKNANSDNEPYTLTYRAGRFGDVFRLVEEYDESIGGIEEHKKQEPFQNLLKSGIVADVAIEHFTEFV